MEQGVVVLEGKAVGGRKAQGTDCVGGPPAAALIETPRSLSRSDSEKLSSASFLRGFLHEFWRERALSVTLLARTRNRAHIRMEFAQAWLAEGPPYHGASEFKHKGEMYKCGGRFDKEKKLWKAIDKDSFVNMVESGKWTPRGVDGPTAVRVIQSAAAARCKTRRARRRTTRRLPRNKKPVLTPEQLEEPRRARRRASPDDKPDELERLAKRLASRRPW